MSIIKNKDPINLVMTGPRGKMGQSLISLLHSQSQRSASVSSDEQKSINLIGFLGREANHLNKLPIAVSLSDFSETVHCVIDFSLPDFSLKIASECADKGIAFVSGTTGFSPEQMDRLKSYSTKIPVLWSANMSLGVNLALALAKLMTQVIGDEADIEIIEAHHRHKIDAPSGTALRLGEAIASEKGAPLSELAEYDRHLSNEPRKEGAIGFSSIRAGEIVGEHQVQFEMEGEQLTLQHKAYNRSIFAKGALKAAMWIVDKPSGMYCMNDVLGLN